MTKKYCDRCKKQEDELVMSYPIYSKDHDYKCWEICLDCVEEFKKFLNNYK